MAAAVSTADNDFFKSNVLGHPAGLFVLFFTEMWERFSFYGMRVLLVNFLTMAIVGVDNPGWGWSMENAGALFGTYAGLLYLTPILGGLVADKLTGYRWAVIIGSVIMTMGHASMAMETEFSLYFGLGLLVIGTGFFKPSITSIISEMYEGKEDKKDGAYTIFYMGVNAGAFFGMMLCGYLAEKIDWSWGFGLAGIFMLLGTLQFWLAKPLFGKIGGVPDKSKEAHEIEEEERTGVKDHKHNPFTLMDKILVFAASTIGFLYLINDPLSRIADLNLLPVVMPFDFKGEPFSGPLGMAIIGLVLFLILVISRLARYGRVVRDRLIAVVIFAFFTVFFWMSFEQGASSLIVFARDSVDRELIGTSATVFNTVNALLTVVPLMI
ncbi:MAG TPA: MFS transporter, partial [Salinimicrobium catena]|nr:MFS transporter [Salinimicrobium catena]